MKVYITKNALTQGIIEDNDAHQCLMPGMIRVAGYGYFSGEGRQWHRSKDDAVRKAEEMRLKKIESLRKQIAKLEKLTFE